MGVSDIMPIPQDTTGMVFNAMYLNGKTDDAFSGTAHTHPTGAATWGGIGGTLSDQADLKGTLDTKSGTAHTHAGGTDPFTKLILLADKPTGANTTPVTTGMAFAYETNSKYTIDIYGMVASATATTGCGFAIDTSGTVIYVATDHNHQLALTGTRSGGCSIGDLAATAKGYSSGLPGTLIYPVSGIGILISGAAAGTATLYYFSETTAVTTLKAGSMMRILKMG
jgi:hypothetical protein